VAAKAADSQARRGMDPPPLRSEGSACAAHQSTPPAGVASVPKPVRIENHTRRWNNYCSGRTSRAFAPPLEPQFNDVPLRGIHHARIRAGRYLQSTTQNIPTGQIGPY